MGDSVKTLADRISAFDFPESVAKERSQVALMREYLRREAWWAQEVGGVCWPFGDLAAEFDETVRADEDLVRQVRSSFPYYVFPIVKDTCVWALHFRALQASGAALPGLPDPYEPLLLMYERGNGFSMCQPSFIDVAGVGVRRGRLADHLDPEPRAPMDPAELDAMDRSPVTTAPGHP
ncbi:hypothetical protein [Marinactinospora rubrisoli]|uniref:Uncharacterized protein n=1 Tax=Marinactinospora rubrisoli TaxID=2715399 RepID=A0ABW2KL17_9ACTN